MDHYSEFAKKAPQQEKQTKSDQVDARKNIRLMLRALLTVCVEKLAAQYCKS
jgi:hypothetical protein